MAWASSPPARSRSTAARSCINSSACCSRWSALVMLIACFTTAGLLLARGVTRAPELGLRLALGAARSRVVRLLVIESLTIALAAAVVAVALAWVGTAVLVNAIPTAPNRNIQLAWGLDWRVVAFSVALSTVLGLVCGLVPAWTATRPMLASTLSRERGGSRAAPAGARGVRRRPGRAVGAARRLRAAADAVDASCRAHRSGLPHGRPRGRGPRPAPRRLRRGARTRPRRGTDAPRRKPAGCARPRARRESCR